MAFPTTSVVDNFNRADGALGGSWSVTNGDAFITSNTVGSSLGGGVRWVGLDTATRPVEVFFTVPTIGNVWLVGCVQDPAVDFWGHGAYALRLVGATQQLILSKYDAAGAETTLGGSGVPGIVAGDSMGMLFGSGGVLEVWRKTGGVWGLVLTATDSTWQSGYYGFVMGGVVGVRVDDFGGGIVGVGSPRIDVFVGA